MQGRGGRVDRGERKEKVRYQHQEKKHKCVREEIEMDRRVAKRSKM